MAYRGYKNYTSQKSYNAGVKVASFTTGLIKGLSDGFRGDTNETIKDKSRINRNKERREF